LRFAFRRPGRLRPVSTRCHRTSCGGSPIGDVAGCVHVGVGPVPASDAPEHRLTLAACRCDVLAGVAGLRRVRGVDLLDPAGGLLLHGPPAGSTRRQDAGSARLLAEVAARRPGCRAPPGHPLTSSPTRIVDRRARSVEASRPALRRSASGPLAARSLLDHGAGSSPRARPAAVAAGSRSPPWAATRGWSAPGRQRRRTPGPPPPPAP
jgi:hypothetical protein